MHPAHLRLMKVGRDPDVIERNNGQKLFTWLHALPDLHGLVADYS